jgi:hypothetical protein
MLGLASSIKKTAEGYPQYRSRASCTFTETGSDYIKFSNHTDFQVNSSDFSVSGWIKITADASGVSNEDGTMIFSAGSGSSPRGGFWLYYLDSTNDNEKFAILTDTGSASGTLVGNADIDHNIWYHVVATYDVSTTTAILYIDGAQDATSDDVAAPSQYTGDVFIGSKDGDAIDAIMCEVIFWKGTILTAAQVKGLYNNGRPRYGLTCERDTIKGYWKLNASDDTGSNNVLDSSGKTHHGTTSGLASADFDTTDVPKEPK